MPRSAYPLAGDLPLSVRGAIPAAGATRYDQAFYRNLAGPCNARSNRTNAVAVTWVP